MRKKKQKASKPNITEINNQIKELNKMKEEFTQNRRSHANELYNPLSTAYENDNIRNSEMNLSHRRVCSLYDEVKEWDREVIASLLKFDSLSDEPIKLHINSPGGSVTSGLAIIDVMNSIESPVDTIVMGSAFSMAGIIAIAGTGTRYMTKSSCLMIHDVGLFAFGSPDDITNRVEYANYLKKRIIDIILSKTKIPKKLLTEKIKEKDWYLTAQECLKYGIIDKII